MPYQRSIQTSATYSRKKHFGKYVDDVIMVIKFFSKKLKIVDSADVSEGVKVLTKRNQTNTTDFIEVIPWANGKLYCYFALGFLVQAVSFSQSFLHVFTKL